MSAGLLKGTRYVLIEGIIHSASEDDSVYKLQTQAEPRCGSTGSFARVNGLLKTYRHQPMRVDVQAAIGPQQQACR